MHWGREVWMKRLPEKEFKHKRIGTATLGHVIAETFHTARLCIQGVMKVLLPSPPSLIII